MTAAIFKHMSETGFALGILKRDKNLPAQRHVNDVSGTIEIWRGADDCTARPQNLPKALKNDIARNWEVFDDFGKKDKVEFGVGRQIRFA